MNKLEELNQNVIAEFRANGGKVGGPWASADVLLLHNVGARSGRARVSPVAYVRDGADLLIVSSFGGAPHNPAWYWNLKAHPRTTIEVGTEIVEVAASEAGDDEYARLWAIITEAMPGMLEYQKRTTRRLPVIRLARV
jgi:deazaflavin-dependent oxidoreductase (nitroreductase family)